MLEGVRMRKFRIQLPGQTRGRRVCKANAIRKTCTRTFFVCQ
jgi:hypothetical protein